MMFHVSRGVLHIKCCDFNYILIRVPIRQLGPAVNNDVQFGLKEYELELVSLLLGEFEVDSLGTLRRPTQ